jgi:hypothetical protein
LQLDQNEAAKNSQETPLAESRRMEQFSSWEVLLIEFLKKELERGFNIEFVRMLRKFICPIPSIKP